MAVITWASCGNRVDRYGETLPQPGEWSTGRGAVVVGSPGDRWLDTMPFVRVERANQDGQPGYKITYQASGIGTFSLFWSRGQIDFTGSPSSSHRSDVPLATGRLYVPDIITARSLPDVHRAILILENSYAKDADGAIAAAEGFAVVASMGSGPRVVRGSLPGSAVRPGVPAARVVATKYKPFTERNFRENLIRFTGRQPRGAHAHHVLPRKYAEDFIAKGINIHDPRYGAWWSAKEHLSDAKRYNGAWDEFFEFHQERTVEEILQFGRKIATEYGLPIYF